MNPGPLNFQRLLPLGLRALATLFVSQWLTAQGPGALAFQTYGSDEGLGALLVEAIEKDDSGYIWVGGQGGLYRLEDQRFRSFGQAFGLGSDRITSLCRNAGTLWVGTEGGLYSFDGRRFGKQTGPLGESAVKTLARDVSGKVWVLADGKLFLGGRDGFEQASVESVRAVWVDPAKPRVLALGEDGQIYGSEGDRGGWTRLGRGPDLGGETAGALLQDHAGQIWIRSRTRLFRGEPGKKFENLAAQFPLGAWEEARLYLDRVGRVWIPSAQGIVLWERGSLSAPRFDLPRSSSLARTVLMDRDGVLWVGGEELHRLLGQGTWTLHRTAEGLPANGIWSLLRDGQGILWAATSQGLARGTQAGWEKLPSTEGLSFSAMVLGPDGRIWASGPKGLLLHSRGGAEADLLRIRAFASTETRISALCFDSEGHLWMASSNAGMLKLRPESPGIQESVALPGGDGRERIHALMRDGLGRLWAAGHLGLAVLEGGVWQRLGPAQGLDGPVLALARAANNELWVSLAAEGALLRVAYEKGRILVRERVDALKGVPHLPLHALAVDPRGVVWAGSAQSILRYADQTLDFFGKGEGLPSSGCNPGAVSVDGDGDVWAGTPGGIGHFRAAHYRGIAPAPRSEVVEARFGKRTLWTPSSFNNVFRLDLAESSAEFSVATLAYPDPAKLRRQVRMVMLDEAWHDLEGSSARYPKLSPGTYQFEVRSRLLTTEWGPTALMRFSVPQPWWRNLWLYGLGGLAAAGGFALLYHRIVGALRRRNLVLQEVVEQRNQDLERALETAEEASRAKDDFLATMSHEIRTPMHAILGMTNLLLESRLTRDQRETAQTIKHASTALMSIIGDILDYAQIEASRIALRSVPFDLRELAEELVDLMAVTAHQKGLELILRYPDPGRGQFVGDPDRLRQILVNLLGNAIKFTSQGWVMLDLESMEDLPDRERIRISVADTGVGIAPEKQKNLFRKFTQADTSIARRFGGTGLGLAITHQLVERMGGTIGLWSELGRGSTCWFELDLPKAEGEEESRAAAEWQALRVMVADDLENSRKAITDRLSNWGIAQGAADTLAEAEAQVARGVDFHDPFNLLLLDESLASDPQDAIRRLRAAAGSSPLVIVLLCPMHQAVDATALQDAGIQGLLRKPIHDWELRETLSRAAGQLNTRRVGAWMGDEEALSSLAATFAEVAPSPWDGHPPKLLLVEDNPLNQQVALRILGGLKAAVTVAGSGAEAVELARAGSFDAILMDVHMPGVDGVQATRQIRAEEQGKRTPIIAMTAHALERDRDRFLEAGMDALLTKPFGREDLRLVLERVLRGLPDAGTPAEDPAQLPSVDRAALLASVTEDRRMDREGFKELLDLFERHAPRHLQRLAAAVEHRDAFAAREAAHSLCGSSAYVYAQALVAQCKAAENEAAVEDLDHLAARMPALEAELTQAWALLEALRTEFTPA
jgi:signal transduction histidine kinase/DNA-binding response OmpR family regulator/ligand-binding sensor domain-containing protein